MSDNHVLKQESARTLRVLPEQKLDSLIQKTGYLNLVKSKKTRRTGSGEDLLLVRQLALRRLLVERRPVEPPQLRVTLLPKGTLDQSTFWNIYVQKNIAQIGTFLKAKRLR